MKLIKFFTAFITILAIFFNSLPSFLIRPTLAQEQEQELQSTIEAKNKELEAIKQEIKSTQNNLAATSDQTHTFEGEVKRLDTNIHQLDLGIRSAEVSISKLSLELSSLNSDINSIEKEIATKAVSMADVLRNVQIKDGEGSFLVFLKSRNLSDGVTEVQNLIDLNNRLVVEAETLKTLKDNLNNKVSDRLTKKSSQEMENQNLKYRKEIIKDQQSEKERLLSFSRQQEAEYARELQELEARQKAIAAEIEEIEERLRANINNDTLLGRRAVLSAPFTDFSLNLISQNYNNSDSFAQNTYTGGKHNGTDFRLPIGTPIFASADGTVAAVANQDAYCYRGAYGKMVAIEHSELQLATLYAHLSALAVKDGQQVKKGDLVGYSGNSGLSTGPHLHYGVYLDQPGQNTFYIGPSRYCGPEMPFGAHTDPLDYLEL